MSLDIGVVAGLQPSIPAAEKISKTYFLWLMLIHLFLATSSPRKLLQCQGLLVIPANVKFVFLTGIIGVHQGLWASTIIPAKCCMLWVRESLWLFFRWKRGVSLRQSTWCALWTFLTMVSCNSWFNALNVVWYHVQLMCLFSVICVH